MSPTLWENSRTNGSKEERDRQTEAASGGRETCFHWSILATHFLVAVFGARSLFCVQKFSLFMNGTKLSQWKQAHCVWGPVFVISKHGVTCTDQLVLAFRINGKSDSHTYVANGVYLTKSVLLDPWLALKKKTNTREFHFLKRFVVRWKRQIDTQRSFLCGSKSSYWHWQSGGETEGNEKRYHYQVTGPL